MSVVVANDVDTTSWHPITIRDLIRKGGGTIKTGPFGTLLKASEYANEGLLVISVGEIGHGTLRVLKHTPHVPPVVVRRLPEYVLRQGDIVFGRKGAVDRSALIEEDDKYFLGSDGIRLRLPETCDPKFMSYQLQSQSVRSWLIQHAIGTTMASLNQSVLESVKVAFPPTIAEQRAIAEALSDVDALINALDALITKKRHIKRGTMQQLLTGKKRLPGFTGEWEEKRLGASAILKARIGWQGLTTDEYLASGDYRLVTGTDFKNGFIDWDHCHYVEYERYRQDKYIQLQDKDVLVTKDGTIGKVAYVDRVTIPATLNSGVFVIRPVDEAFEPRFFYCLLCSRVFDEFLTQLAAGSTINHLYQKDFVNFKFTLPPTIDEQAAIATVVTDMDAEITALTQKRDKTKLIKQGMMQELLTGKTRLI